ncbi:MAG: ATP-dependent Clp protease adaptor ClpS [Caldilineaceae bacterium]|nr:ATP-dependent Clp protease adaptor ClpS [Caldilineaceae bacterium]
MTTARLTAETVAAPAVVAEQVTDLEPRYRVIIHNDDVTTFEYVHHILKLIFRLSHEIADHIAWKTHREGAAVVVTRPRPEAERLVRTANQRARADGFPLTFTAEPEEEGG